MAISTEMDASNMPMMNTKRAVAGKKGGFKAAVEKMAKKKKMPMQSMSPGDKQPPAY